MSSLRQYVYEVKQMDDCRLRIIFFDGLVKQLRDVVFDLDQQLQKDKKLMEKNNEKV
jgi:hypothetical protein